MFERFTEAARHVLVLAQEEARLLNHGFIGTEHLLLGLIREDQSIAGRTLDALGISLESARIRVEETIPKPRVPPSGSLPFTPRAKKVLEFSLREALQLADSDIGPEHLLLGLVDEREGVGASILVNLGADISRVRQVVLMQMADVTSEQLDQEAESERRHIVEGLLRGIDEIDDVNRAVRNCPDRISALQVLTSLPFEYTEVQARHVLALRVESLLTNRSQALRDELHNLESKGGDGD